MDIGQRFDRRRRAGEDKSLNRIAAETAKYLHLAGDLGAFRG